MESRLKTLSGMHGVRYYKPWSYIEVVKGFLESQMGFHSGDFHRLLTIKGVDSWQGFLQTLFSFKA